MTNHKQKWKVKSITDFVDAPLIDSLTQFGFHVHTGESYLLQNDEGYMGLIEGDHLAWTAGETDPGFADLHYPVTLLHPKFIDRAFHHDILLITTIKRSIFQTGGKIRREHSSLQR